MEKYELLPLQLMHEGTFTKDNFFEPKAISEEDILAIHDFDYWEKLSQLKLNRQEELRSGFPHSKQLIDRELIITGGTLEASMFALEYGISFNIAGGTHHGFADHGEGFCLLNDQAIAASHLLRNGIAQKILIIDLDVHQGNGTAKIFEKENRVFTFSMHGDRNYPLRKEKSDLDIPLPDKISGEEYLKILEKHLVPTIDKVKPDFIFYQCGVDILASDKLDRLGVSIEDYKRRDRMVLEAVAERNIPCTACMGGGYSEDIKIIVNAHANTYRLAKDIFE